LIVPLGLANLARYVDPDRNAADYLAALIFSFYGTPEIAIEAADAVPPESWLYGYVILEKANAAQDAGTAEDAIAILRQASRAEKRPEPQWALQLHILLAAEGRYDEADEAGTVAIREAERLGVLPSSLWRYYFARGANRLDAGRDEAAFADLEKTLELAPDEPIILNHLGYSYVERAQQLERAFGMIERAVEIEPQNGSIVDSLGWAYFQRGFYDKAVERLEEAVQLEPADAVITDHLGDAYFMTGRSRDAQYEWRRVLSLEDADDELRSAAAAKLEGDYSSSPTLEGVEAR
jgi:Flp pilus assembly protein TadD